MSAFVVTAGNSAFYQTLVVDAESKEEAVKLFQEYLDADANQSAEAEEYEMALDLYENGDDDRPDRDDYTYDFDEEDVEECEEPEFKYHNTASPTVTMVASGGNG